MKVAAILPALALVALALRAQTPSAKPGSIDGTVTNSVTNEPIKKAIVTLGRVEHSGSTPLTAMTDAAGHFHFEGVEPGSYVTRAEKDGFLDVRNRRPGPAQPVAVAEDQQVQDITLQLLPLAVISGHVFDEDGDPIVGANITVLRYFYGRGRKRLSETGAVQSNDLGEFEVVNVAPGRYYFQVTAWPPRNIPQRTHWAHAESAYPITFYPNVRDAGEAQAIDVAAGAQVSNIDFRLRKMPAYHIRGTFSGEIAGHSAADGEVNISTSGLNFDTSVTYAVMQADGSFDARGVVRGSYEVSYMRSNPGDASPSYFDQTVRVSDSDVNAVLLVGKPPVAVSGTVAVEGSQPVKLGMQVFVFSARRVGPPANARVEADGKFVLAAIPPLVCQLQIENVPAGNYVKSIRFGDLEVDNGEIDLTDKTSASLSIVLGADGGEVDGTVQTAGGQPAPSALVTLAAAEQYDGRTDLFKRAVTDARGNFQIKDVAPGEYKVFAWESDPDRSTQSAEFRKPFESRSAAVTIGAKDKASVQLVVITSDDVDKERSKLP